MAQILSASIYGLNSTPQGTDNGVTIGLPTQGILISDISNNPKTFNGVDCISKIAVLPTGLMLPNSVSYYSASTAADLITAANA